MSEDSIKTIKVIDKGYVEDCKECGAGSGWEIWQLEFEDKGAKK